MGKKVIKLTESDLVKIVKRVIEEQRISDLPQNQQSPSLKSNDLRSTLSPEQQQQYKDMTRGQKDLSKVYNSEKQDKSPNYKIDDHDLSTILSLGVALIPVVGPFIAVGISLYDAASYYKEGDVKNAGLTATLALLPGASTLVTKIPGIKELGAKGMSTLATKLASNSKLTKLESDVAKGLSANQSLVQKELSNIVSSTAKKAAATTTKPSTKKVLTDIGKKGINFTAKTAKEVAPKEAVSYTYNTAYDTLIPKN